MADKNQNGQNSKKYQVQHDRAACIGCGACAAVAPDVWKMGEEGKSEIVNGKRQNEDLDVLDIDEKDLQMHKEAAEACPVNAIHIIEKKTGKKII